jgi:ubiquinone/menaquinone biosynthesis C-methylase UbiE
VTGDLLRPGGLTLTDRALALCALPAGAKILDAGCGTGATVAHLATRHHLNAFGFDVSGFLLQSGRSHNAALPLAQAQGERLPVGNGQLDAVIVECSLSVMADADRALKEFGRVLRSDGVLVVSDVYVRNPDSITALRRLPFASCLRGALLQYEFAEKLSRHGFHITLWQDHSDMLRQFAAQLIWTHGSLTRFWRRAASAVDPQDVQQVITQAKPGYFLSVARKMGGA